MASDATVTSPGLRIFACARCSRRKQRCDRRMPTCTPCQAARSPCLTSAREEKVVQVDGQEVHRKGYVTNLLERIASLELAISQAGIGPTGRPESEAGRETADAGAPPSSSLPLSTTSDLAAAQTPSSNQGSNWPTTGAGMNMETLSLSAMAEPLSRAGEFLKQLSMPRIVSGVTQTYGGNPEAIRRVDSLWDGISKYIRHPSGRNHRIHMKPAEASRALETYLDVVDFRFPRLPCDKVRLGLDAIAAESDERYHQTLANDPAHIFMAYMVMTIVPLVSDDYPISQGSFVSIQLLGKCLEVLDSVFRKEDGVDIVQCLHLLVIFSIHCSAAGSAWHLIGFAMNKCIALRYHLEPTCETRPCDSSELEQRRWAFWGCYLLDRLLCSSLDRPHSIDDRYITVLLPGEAGAAVMSHSLAESFHLHLFQYARLLSFAFDENCEQDFDELLGRLLHWRSKSPAHSEESSRQSYLFQTSLFHTLMLKIGVREVIKGYDFSESEGRDTIVRRKEAPGSASDGQRGPASEQVLIVQRIKLFEICCSVARSIDRSRMTGRHFLSLITGYSAFSMALATLYHKAIMQGQSQCGCQPLREPAVVYQSTATTATATTATARPGSAVAAKECIHWDDIVNLALQKLEVVGRQFPRMYEYKQVLEALQQRGAAGQDPETVVELLSKIGPRPARHLAFIIWTLR